MKDTITSILEGIDNSNVIQHKSEGKRYLVVSAEDAHENERKIKITCKGCHGISVICTVVFMYVFCNKHRVLLRNGFSLPINVHINTCIQEIK
jgi:hypothetical protein